MFTVTVEFRTREAALRFVTQINELGHIAKVKEVEPEPVTVTDAMVAIINREYLVKGISAHEAARRILALASLPEPKGKPDAPPQT